MASTSARQTRFVSFILHWSFSPVQRMASTSTHQTKVCVLHTSLVILTSPKNGLNISTPDKVCVIPTSLVILTSPKNGLNIGTPDKVCVIPTSLVILASPKNGLNIGTPDKGLCHSYSYFTGHSRQSKEWPQHRHTRQGLCHSYFTGHSRQSKEWPQHRHTRQGLCHSYFTGHSRQSKEWPQHRPTRQRFASFLLHWSFSPVQRMASTSAHQTKVCRIPTSLVILASPKNGLNIGTPDKGLCHSYFTGHSRQSKEWPQHRHTRQRFVEFILHWSFSPVQRMASTSAHQTKVCVIPTSLVILASPKNGLNIDTPDKGLCHSYFTCHLLKNI